jgi:mannose-6-phosphate isomerase-like protein (cupin superfamily)
MKFIKKSQANKIIGGKSTTIWEYMLSDDNINGAIAEINGRYPDKDRVVNEKSKELVYVLSGKGKLVVEGKEIKFSSGDMLIIDQEEKYYWQGNFKIFMANTPKWTPEQHKLVK